MTPPQPARVWDIWSEGYAATGEHGGATCHARGVEAVTFQDAAIKHFGSDRLFDASRMTYWGCRLFDNAADARVSFG